MDVGTILSVIDLVERAVAIYRCINDLPEEMADLGRRMVKLNLYLSRLKGLVTPKPGSSTTLSPADKAALNEFLTDIEANAGKVKDLFERYQAGIISRTHDLQFRVDWAARLYYSYISSSPENIQALIKKIDDDISTVTSYFTLVNFDQNPTSSASLSPALGGPSTTSSRTPSPRVPSPRLPPGSLSPSADLRTATVNPGTRSPRVPSPRIPSPRAPPQTTPPLLKILFLDPFNGTRSLLAESLTRLLRQQARLANQPFPISHIHSAGFFIRTGSDCLPVISNLPYNPPSYKLPFSNGFAPHDVALSSLFDSPAFKFPFPVFKDELWGKMKRRKAEGVKRETFGKYDYICVFTKREAENLGVLRLAMGGGGKAKVVQLAGYVGKSEIWVTVDQGIMAKREYWDGKTGDVANAVKGFLKEVGCEVGGS
ncbi:hypothetical protein OQA88_2163 [Cercophora sp. LCS_1]